jgi:predicted polyphosphate/ATP-dependent NAD kinase
MFRLGLVINPLAGIGGPLGLKGSDGQALVAQALAQGVELRAPARAVMALEPLLPVTAKLQVLGFSGAMAEDAVLAVGLPFVTIGTASWEQSTAEDTITAARRLKAEAVDLLLFVGGDGTARDIAQAVGSDFPVLGVPAGVKMHSGVYAISPAAAGEITLGLVNKQLIDISLSEVRDIDEEAFRQGRVRSRFYGELLVPRTGGFLQHVKAGGREVEELVLEDIAAQLLEDMDEDCLYLVGPGSTTVCFMSAQGLQNTLLGVDVVKAGELLASDANEQTLLDCLVAHHGPVKIIITAIGGQGHILGRGNQQFSPQVIRAVGLDNIVVIATKTKITALEGRPLLVDSGDPALDKALQGYRQIVTGYRDVIIYPVGFNQ